MHLKREAYLQAPVVQELTYQGSRPKQIPSVSLYLSHRALEKFYGRFMIGTPHCCLFRKQVHEVD